MSTTLEVTSAISSIELYKRIGLHYINSGSHSMDSDDTLPDNRIFKRNMKANLRDLKEYRKICSLPVDSCLPLTYPHIMAFPLHILLMLSEGFPFKLIGLVHVSNSITQYRPIANLEALTIECSLDNLVTVAKGKQFDILTKVWVRDELVWESASTMIHRCRTSIEEVKKEPSEFPPLINQVAWRAPENIGRRYGKNAQDINPIHMNRYLARAFGFPTLIAHGMWSKARSLGELDALLPKAPLNVSVDFKLPILLPNTVLFEYQQNADGIDFMVKDKYGLKPHLAGKIVSDIR